jgi:hypothetical protein
MESALKWWGSFFLLFTFGLAIPKPGITRPWKKLAVNPFAVYPNVYQPFPFERANKKFIHTNHGES